MLARRGEGEVKEGPDGSKKKGGHIWMIVAYKSECEVTRRLQMKDLDFKHTSNNDYHSMALT